MENKRTNYSNLLIVSVLLKSYCAPYIQILEDEYPEPSDKLEAVRNMASDDGNEEIVDICDFIERMNLTETFFPA